MVGPTYHSLTACGAHVFWFSGFSWTSTFIPGGAIGVWLKSWAHADRFGFIWDPCIRLSVRTAWWMSQSNKCSGNCLSVVQSPAMKWFLKVNILLILLHCINVAQRVLIGSLCLVFACNPLVMLNIHCLFVGVWVIVLLWWVWCGLLWMLILFLQLFCFLLVQHGLSCYHNCIRWTTGCCQCSMGLWSGPFGQWIFFHWWCLLWFLHSSGECVCFLALMLASSHCSWLVSFGVSVVASSGKVTFGLVDCWFCQLWSRCPLMVAMDWGGCWHNVFAVNPGKWLM